jgi:hypothetical protein
VPVRTQPRRRSHSPCSHPSGGHSRPLRGEPASRGQTSWQPELLSQAASLRDIWVPLRRAHVLAAHRAQGTAPGDRWASDSTVAAKSIGSKIAGPPCWPGWRADWRSCGGIATFQRGNREAILRCAACDRLARLAERGRPTSIVKAARGRYGCLREAGCQAAP